MMLSRAETTAPALEIKVLSKRFGETVAIDAASFRVAKGEFVAVLGSSGAGKSTLFRCITQLTKADAGEVHLGGEPLSGLLGGNLMRARRSIGLIFQQFNLIGRMSALDNVLVGRIGHAPTWRVVLRHFSSADRTLALEALDSVGLLGRAYQRADSLSGGQQQRVAIARVIAQQCRIILADEPVASLDPATSDSVMQTLQATARERGLGVLCSLHQTDLALRYADRIIAMRAGKIVLDAKPGQISCDTLRLLYDPTIEHAEATQSHSGLDHSTWQIKAGQRIP
ncbi:MAG: phosphonate ABC transporter ATP-binding protein [Bosea sp. (in: a-proteobacteria)]